MKTIKWPDHIVNFFIVLISISIAFWLDGYRSSLEDKKIEHRNLEGFKSDLSEDLSNMDSIIAIYANIEQSFDFIDNRTFTKLSWKSKDDSLLLHHLFRTQYLFQYMFIPNNITYESIRASGRFDIITNQKLRKAIINLNYKTYKRVWQQNTNFERFLNENTRDDLGIYAYRIDGNQFYHFDNNRTQREIEGSKKGLVYYRNRVIEIQSQTRVLYEMINKELDHG